MSGPDGRFIWAEYMAEDPDAAAAFYAGVVGWTVADFGPGNPDYKVLSAGDRSVGGIMAVPAEAKAGGARPGWFPYVQVSDVDQAVARIVGAGGQACKAPFDVPDVGRIAMVTDPGGASFYLLAPSPQGELPPEPDPDMPGLVSWHELYAGQGQEAAMAFYHDQFGWESIDAMDMGPMGIYRIFGKDGRQMGGMMDKPEAIGAAHWGLYFNVDGLGAAIQRVEKGGGQVLMGPHEVPGGSWIIQGLDPQGGAFALVSTTR